jgi:hypothetical protein
MGLSDFGNVNDSLANPPLGGPNGWAAAVVEAIEGLQEQHTIRSTRPNTTDHLVEVFDGSEWVIVRYDSGWRDWSALLATPSNFTDANIQVRRIDDFVEVVGTMSVAAGATCVGQQNTGTLFDTTQLPGFKLWGIQFTEIATLVQGNLSEVCRVTGFGYLLAIATYRNIEAGASMAVRMRYPTGDPIPTSLPGTANTPAPAPPPDQP